MARSSIVTTNTTNLASLDAQNSALLALQNTANAQLLQFNNDLAAHVVKGTEAHGFVVTPTPYIAPPFANLAYEPSVFGTHSVTIPTTVGNLIAPASLTPVGTAQ